MMGIKHTISSQTKKVSWNQTHTNTLTQPCLIRPRPEWTLTCLDYLCVGSYLCVRARVCHGDAHTFWIMPDVGISRSSCNSWSNHKYLNSFFPPNFSIKGLGLSHLCQVVCVCMCSCGSAWARCCLCLSPQPHWWTVAENLMPCKS